MISKKTEVLVAGAGPVGLFTALTLAKRGVEVGIVDTGVWASTHSYALALHPQTLELLEGAGLAEKSFEQLYPVRRAAFFDGNDRRCELHLCPGHDGWPYMAVVRQSLLEELLEKQLKKFGVHVQWRHEASSFTMERDRVGVTINEFERESRGYAVAHSEWVVAHTQEVSVPYVAGADGHNSRVRRVLDIDFPEVGPAAYFAVFEFKSDMNLKDKMRVVLAPDAVSTLWPLPGSYVRWSFQLPGYTDQDAEALKDRLFSAGFGYFPTKRFKYRNIQSGSREIPMLEEEYLKVLLAERARWFHGSIGEFSWRTIVRFERRQSNAFGRDRMWLAGDAAHVTMPAGDSSCSELRAYNDRWMAEWRRLQSMDGGLRPRSDTDPWVTANVDRLLPCIPAHGGELFRLAAQLNLEVALPQTV